MSFLLNFGVMKYLTSSLVILNLSQISVSLFLIIGKLSFKFISYIFINFSQFDKKHMSSYADNISIFSLHSFSNLMNTSFL